jgi:hypothetical protein
MLSKLLILAGGLALAACTSVLPPPPGTGEPTIGPIAATNMMPAPVKGDSVRIAFVKSTGGPRDCQFTFDDSAKSEAKARKLNVVPEDDPNVTYRVKPSLSAVGGIGMTTGTTFVYVLDVLDARGVRVHRIAGQWPGAGAMGDPWAGIKDPTIVAAAHQAIDGLAAWVHAI